LIYVPLHFFANTIENAVSLLESWLLFKGSFSGLLHWKPIELINIS